MNSNKKTVGIIGFGKVGGSLSFALSRKGFTVFVHTRIPPDKNITRHNFVSSIHTLIEKTSIIFITVPDSKIKNIARDIASTRTSLKNKIIFHTSGSLTSQVLTIVKRKGASAASFHPLQTFPHIVDSLSIWKNIYCVLEGDKRAVATGKLLCKTLCMKSLVLPAENKIYYHSAAVFASNFLVLLIAMSQQLAEYAGINKKQFMILFQLFAFCIKLEFFN